MPFLGAGRDEAIDLRRRRGNHEPRVVEIVRVEGAKTKDHVRVGPREANRWSDDGDPGPRLQKAFRFGLRHRAAANDEDVASVELEKNRKHCRHVLAPKMKKAQLPSQGKLGLDRRLDNIDLHNHVEARARRLAARRGSNTTQQLLERPSPAGPVTLATKANCHRHTLESESNMTKSIAVVKTDTDIYSPSFSHQLHSTLPI